MRLPFAKPLNKVSRGTFTAAFVVVLSWGLREFTVIDLPGEVQAALAVLIGYIVSYNTPLSEVEAKLIARKYYRDEAPEYFAHTLESRSDLSQPTQSEGLLDELRRING